mmetsp:Transcript_16188/g.33492  ORF Transcript_16188/g.33492 Transcript_16188/m.33492 type:complete len:112 (+) Transcript_16188:317-652(+)
MVARELALKMILLLPTFAAQSAEQLLQPHLLALLRPSPACPPLRPLKPRPVRLLETMRVSCLPLQWRRSLAAFGKVQVNGVLQPTTYVDQELRHRSEQTSVKKSYMDNSLS